MRTATAVLVGILTLCLGVLLVGLWKSGGPPADDGPNQPAGPGPSAKKIRVEVYSKDGKTLAYLIEAPRARKLTDEKFEVEKPDITIFDKDQPDGMERKATARVTANKGYMMGRPVAAAERKEIDKGDDPDSDGPDDPPGGQKMSRLHFTSGELDGDVRIWSYSGDPADTLQVMTASLSVDLEQKIVSTNDRVTLRDLAALTGEEGRWAEARGMDLDPDLGRLTLHGEVRIEFPSGSGRFVVTTPAKAIFEQLDLRQLRAMKLLSQIPPEAWARFDKLGAVKAVKIRFLKPEPSSDGEGRVVMKSGGSRMEADFADLYAYREQGGSEAESGSAAGGAGALHPVYMDAHGDVRMSQEPGSEDGKPAFGEISPRGGTYPSVGPAGRSEAAGDNFVWYRSDAGDRLEDRAILSSRGGAGRLKARYVSTTRTDLLGEGASPEPLPGGGSQTVLFITCDEEMLFVRDFPGDQAKGKPAFAAKAAPAGGGKMEEKSYARFRGNVAVRRLQEGRPATAGKSDDEGLLRGADYVVIDFKPVPVGPKATRNVAVQRIEAVGRLRIEEPQRQGWGKRLVWRRDWRYDDGRLVEMHTTLSGANPGVLFRNRGSAFDPSAPARRVGQEEITIACSDVDGELIFDRGVTGADGRPADDLAAAYGGVRISRQELDEAGGKSGEPVTVDCRGATMIMESAAAAAQGRPSGAPAPRHGSMREIIADGGVIVTMPDGVATGEHLVWRSGPIAGGGVQITLPDGRLRRVIADGVLRTTELVGSPGKRPGIALAQAAPGRTGRTTIDCARRIIFTQILYVAATSPIVKEERYASLLSDVHCWHEEADKGKKDETATDVRGDRVGIDFIPEPWKPAGVAETRRFDAIEVMDDVTILHYRRPAGDPRGWLDHRDELLALSGTGDRFTWKDSGGDKQVGVLSAVEPGRTTVVSHGKTPVTTHPSRFEINLSGGVSLP